MEGVIDEKNAPKLKCKVLAEAANGPLTFEADQIIKEKGIFSYQTLTSTQEELRYPTLNGSKISPMFALVEWIEDSLKLKMKE